MKQAFRQIVVVALLLLVFCVVCRLAASRSYTVRIPLPEPALETVREGGASLSSARPEVASPGAPALRGGYLSFPVRPGRAGETEIAVTGPTGAVLAVHSLNVTPLGTVYDPQTAGFTGDSAVLFAVTLFWAFVCAVMLWHYAKARGPAYYAYSTVYFAALSLFSAVTALLMIRVTSAHLLRPEQFSMFGAYDTINGAPIRFMMLTLPLTALFALSMLVSNIALLRHERPRLKNLLGIGVALLLLAGEAVGALLYLRDFSGSEREWRVFNTLENVFATAFAYFECVLFGAVICGFTAARREPSRAADYIIILGCWFRKDGSLPPLLRGRADRALSFWRRQKAASGKEAVLIPSGGKGRDEPMPEAEAIARYLLAQGVPPACVRPEPASLNTFQNMANSRRLIEEAERQNPRPDGAPPSVVFATTNYHVFRSGLWAARAGLEAEGIGGRTKWWFWPNAFMRECVSLLQRRWKQELLCLVALIAFFAALSMVLG